MDVHQLLTRLKGCSNPETLAGMARYGIITDKALGIKIPVLRQIAKEIGKNHILADELWQTNYLEARMLASMIDEPSKVREEQMELWVKEFNSWDICDQVCSNLFEKTALAYPKAFEWAERQEEFTKRAGFVLMARLAVSDKEAPDSRMEEFFPVIIAGSTDERNFVKKAVNWALRQIGKRNIPLNLKAIEIARVIKQIDTKTARWIAADALRELTGPEVQKRLALKAR